MSSSVTLGAGRAKDRCHLHNFETGRRCSKRRRLKTPVLPTATFSIWGNQFRPILCTFRPYPASAVSPRSKVHSASFEV
jgi:hypothetical protein